MLWDEQLSIPKWKGEALAEMAGEPWAPPDVVLALQASNKTPPDEDGYRYVIEADAGRGRVVHYNGVVKSEVVWHENGHVVAGAVNRLGQSGIFSDQIEPGYFSYEKSNAPGRKWNDLMEADARHLHKVDFGDPEEGTFTPLQTFNKVRRLGIGSNMGFGVTDYGATSPTEDFAESWRLFVQGDIGTYKPKGSDEWKTVTFKEMFPNRYNYFKELERQIGDVEFPDGAVAKNS